MIITYTGLISCLKVLLTPAYTSTDFEVHRNWMAVTYNLPLKEWYKEDTSVWTLDYPPFFAFLEFLLAQFAYYFDPDMLEISKDGYISDAALVFQRWSVTFADLLFVYGTKCCMDLFSKRRRSGTVLLILLVANAGLLMIDHIHFQYNGLLYGVMLMSIVSIVQEKYFLGAFYFAFLLNLKHIFMYVAPVYFVYLLRHCCFKKGFKDIGSIVKNFTILGSIVIGVFAVSLGPFVDQLPQLFSRLFPFKRGLSHSYWAPNFWALYNGADKAAAVLAVKMGMPILKANNTGGLVQEFEHSILPSVTPLMTILLTVVAMIPILVKLWSSKDKGYNFIRAIVLCGLTSFMFGWHVHEKAILMAVIPLTILAVVEPFDARIFLNLSTVAFFSFFPLLFVSKILPIKTAILVIYVLYAFYSLQNLYPNQCKRFALPLLNIPESLYILGLIPLFMYTEGFHFVLTKKYEFLPLLMTSLYCALGITYSWIRYYFYFIVKTK